MSTVRAVAPVEEGVTDGLSWARFAPTDPPAAGVVVLHGADSAKESHYDFAHVCVAAGLAALVFDARGHGASDGALDGRAIDDVARMADLLRERGAVARVGLRGSSMGGYLALVSARAAGAAAVVAICPASAQLLGDALRAGRPGFPYDAESLPALLDAYDATDAVRALEAALLLVHAEDDEVVPVAVSRALHAAARPGHSTLVVVPGGHHRSIQHDPHWQQQTVRFLAGALGQR
jgi:fermentation-respiration switch protein FrsA (DUF1100 family)